MVAYQNEAVELGFLHSRFLRGVAPPDFAAIGQEHVDRMRALRPGLRLAATRRPGDRPHPGVPAVARRPGSGASR